MPDCPSSPPPRGSEVRTDHQHHPVSLCSLDSPTTHTLAPACTRGHWRAHTHAHTRTRRASIPQVLPAVSPSPSELFFSHFSYTYEEWYTDLTHFREKEHRVSKQAVSSGLCSFSSHINSLAATAPAQAPPCSF